jgi:hypothetical protein
MPLQAKNKRQFCHPLLVIPGPKEPTNLEPYLEKLLLAFERYGPSIVGSNEYGQEGGMLATEHTRRAADGAIQQRSFKHRIFLSGVAADTLACRKLSYCQACQGTLGCQHCWLKSVAVPGGGRAFKYATASDVGVPEELRGKDGFVDIPTTAYAGNHDRCKVTHEQHCQRAEWAEVELATATTKAARTRVVKTAGCHGLSPFMRHLGHYLDYNNVWVVPFAHAALLGVTKRYFTLLFEKIGKRSDNDLPKYVMRPAARKKVKARGDALSITNDFNRPYKDIVDRRGSYVMEDWLNFVDSFSLYVLGAGADADDIWPCDEMRQAWWELRGAIIHYTRHHAEGFTDEARQKARKSLYAYSRLMEQVAGRSVCQYTLHVLNCRLYDQETARGHVSHDLEFWVERMVQYMKSNVKFRTTGCPELLFVSDLLIDDCLASRSREEGMHTFDQWVPAYRTQDKRRPRGGDDGHAVPGEDRMQLFGVGTQLDGDALSDAFGYLRRYVSDCGDSNIGLTWRDRLQEGGDTRGVVIRRHKYGCVGWQEFHSTSHMLSRTRVNTFCVCEFDEEVLSPAGEPVRKKVQYVGHIRDFYLVSHVDEPEANKALRLAVCDLYKARVVMSSAGVSEMWMCSRPVGQAHFGSYIVPLASFVAKVCHGGPGRTGGQGVWYAWRYNNTSRLLGAEAIV